MHHLPDEGQRAPSAGAGRNSPTRPAFVARSASFDAALRSLERFARCQMPVLLEGESGTGKSFFARHLHLVSRRAQQVFHTVDLAALDDSLASSELFGHVNGAFTGARQARHGHLASAHGGTVFLDEIGKASRIVQQKLLRVIEYGELCPVGGDRPVHLDVRIVAATNIPLVDLVASGNFLDDLRARFGMFVVSIPPLRERRDDIPELVRQAVQRHAPACGYAGVAPRIEGPLMRALQLAPWPNNHRELDSAVQRLLVDADGAAELGLTHCEGALEYLRALGRDREKGESKRVIALEPHVAAEAMKAAAGNASVAAKRLDVARSTLYRALDRLAASGNATPPALAKGTLPLPVEQRVAQSGARRP